jgi:hypothetical protein
MFRRPSARYVCSGAGRAATQRFGIAPVIKAKNAHRTLGFNSQVLRAFQMPEPNFLDNGDLGAE